MTGPGDTGRGHAEKGGAYRLQYSYPGNLPWCRGVFMLWWIRPGTDPDQYLETFNSMGVPVTK